MLSPLPKPRVPQAHWLPSLSASIEFKEIKQLLGAQMEEQPALLTSSPNPEAGFT